MVGRVGRETFTEIIFTLEFANGEMYTNEEKKIKRSYHLPKLQLRLERYRQSC